MGLIILILTGISAARADSVAEDNTDTGGGALVDTGSPVIGDPFAGGDAPAEFPPQEAPGSSATDDQSDVSARWTTALIAMSNIVLAWLLLVGLLCQVSLIKGKAPRLTNNFQVAVWASVPLALMAALQIVYYAAGGQVGKPGLAGLLPEWDRYAESSRSTRSILLSAATRTTLFGLWTLILAYFGARHTLKGHWSVALSVVLIWLLLIVMIPVVAKTIEAPKATEESQPGEELPVVMPMDEMAPGVQGDVISPDGTSGEQVEPVQAVPEKKPYP